jgi:hypothetical protein
MEIYLDEAGACGLGRPQLTLAIAEGDGFLT